jgi:hypothetical protein
MPRPVFLVHHHRAQVNSSGASGGWAVYKNLSSGAALGKVKTPQSIFVDSQGRMLIADTGNNGIQLFNGTSFVLFVGSGSTASQVMAPQGVTESAQGNVFIGDTGNNCLKKKPISGAGGAVVVGLPGTAVGQFEQPSGVR